jgi:hypothetical protein
LSGKHDGQEPAATGDVGSCFLLLCLFRDGILRPLIRSRDNPPADEKRRHRNVDGGTVDSNNPFRRFLKPLLFFLLLVFLGILLGKILFSLPDWPVWLKTLLR